MIKILVVHFPEYKLRMHVKVEGKGGDYYRCFLNALFSVDDTEIEFPVNASVIGDNRIHIISELLSFVLLTSDDTDIDLSFMPESWNMWLNDDFCANRYNLGSLQLDMELAYSENEAPFYNVTETVVGDFELITIIHWEEPKHEI
jgi:hypothetical protein